jgi:hypothetical protein
MSIEHKAFIFDMTPFDLELRPILEQALRSGATDRIKAYVEANRGDLKDPYEGEPLQMDWEDMIEDRDVHQYGDFALTKYYSPLKDGGLGSVWEEVQDIVANVSDIGISPILGVPLAVGDTEFDPGKFGSYFQSQSQVRDSFQRLNSMKNVVGEGLRVPFEGFVQLLSRAVEEGKGLYVTF